MTLNKKIKTICFDIDNVICLTKGSNYRKSKPIKQNIKFINYLYDNVFTVKLITARYMGRNNDNISKAKKQGYKLTLRQLKSWKIKYQTLFLENLIMMFLLMIKVYFLKKTGNYI